MHGHTLPPLPSRFDFILLARCCVHSCMVVVGELHWVLGDGAAGQMHRFSGLHALCIGFVHAMLQWVSGSVHMQAFQGLMTDVCLQNKDY